MPKRTYLTLTLNSEGANLSEVAKVLEKIGFVPTKGSYDFVYEWEKENIPVEELIKLAERVQYVLKGKQVLFQITTP